ncbi:anti-sigma B factor antagonist [Anaerosolibacter carboniphilus]|uniref:Anti-sigma B factor antagonist n=2 Tax=Anaerosolibacter carboniphilus TaxID=1417629 RepID=A0A841KMN4_9FIRM|nr:anti-sigma B factor antagonist [Anaerosolibacter carboniphilus]
MKEIFLQKELHQFDPIALRYIFLNLIEEHDDAKTISVDFTAIEYVTGIFLGALVFFLKKAKDRGITIQLVNVRPDIERIFRLTALDRIFTINSSTWLKK